ncbi:hypothetical protein [Micromonospora sp. KC721]|nr:hypothetical protein [Micromonospora sp. KC721]
MKLRTPSRHLVAYFLMRDAEDGSVLLVDHRTGRLRRSARRAPRR